MHLWLSICLISIYLLADVNTNTHLYAVSLNHLIKLPCQYIRQAVAMSSWSGVIPCVINVSVPLSGQPRTLQDLCRIKIRHCIGLQSLKFLEDLPIAKVMKDYLKHKFDNVWRQQQEEEVARVTKNSLLSFIKTMQSPCSLSGRHVQWSVL